MKWIGDNRQRNANWIALQKAEGLENGSKKILRSNHHDSFGFEDSVAHTPHIGQLAAQGVRLTRFLVPMPYCAPSRASLLTGRYPYRTGVVYNPTPDRGID